MGSAENFIPWEQIKPLLEPGLTPNRLARKIIAMCGLIHGPDGGYNISVERSRGEGFWEAVRGGVYVRPWNQGRVNPAWGDGYEPWDSSA